MNEEEKLIRYGDIIQILTRRSPSPEETKKLFSELKEIEAWRKMNAIKLGR